VIINPKVSTVKQIEKTPLSIYTAADFSFLPFPQEAHKTPKVRVQGPNENEQEFRGG
jgi:hypothetical protein